MAAQNFAYLFEAKGIQRYILDSGPLRDLIGGSDLVSGLARSTGTVLREDKNRKTAEAPDLIGRVLEALDIEHAENGARQPGQVEFSRQASAAVMLHADEPRTLKEIRALLRLAVALRCPGLEFSDVEPVGAADDAAAGKKVYQSASALRSNSGAELPPTGHPVVAFNPRTGRVATRLFGYREDMLIADGLTEAHRLRAARLGDRRDGVALRYLGGDRLKDPAGRRYVFPRNVDPQEGDTADNPLFPFVTPDDRRIAVVHADLSGLGQLWQGPLLKNSPPADRRRAAQQLEEHVETAAQKAVAEILLPKARPHDDWKIGVVPARPVVLGGDDLTILVRADLALDFTARLLANIEEPVEINGRRVRLSACAGVAIVRAGQPFLMAQALAESLCSFAKKAAKHRRQDNYPSMLAFHNATSTLQEEYDDIFAREQTAAGTTGGATLRLTGNPYLVGDPPEPPAGATAVRRPHYEKLRALAEALGKDARGLGKLVELAHRLEEPPSENDRENWARWRDVLRGRNEKAVDGIDQVLRDGFGIEPNPQKPPLAAGDEIDPDQPGGSVERGYFPLADALELISLRAVPVEEN